MSRTRYQVYSHEADTDHAKENRERYGSDGDSIQTLLNTEVDELVIDRWFHIEQMDKNRYWMDIGGLTVNVTVAKDGTAKHVMWELDGRADGTATTFNGEDS